MILNSHHLSPNFLLWLVLGVFLMATTLRMYATCQQLQAQAQAHAVAATGLLGHTELRLHMPTSIALQGLRLQLALQALQVEFNKAAQSLTDALVLSAQKKSALGRLIKVHKLLKGLEKIAASADIPMLSFCRTKYIIEHHSTVKEIP
nr:E3 ubiquitin-protein ligase SDIR1-like isoform X1 [Ipomoea batatas]